MLSQTVFFASSIKNWNETDYSITQSKSFISFRNSILKMIKHIPNSIFDACDPVGIQLLTRLRVGLSHLRHHKFRHNFRHPLNPICIFSLEPENTSPFLLYCHRYDNLCQTLMSNFDVIDPSIPLMGDVRLVHLLLYGDKKYDLSTNEKILQRTIKFLKDSLRFDEPLL